MNKKTITKSKFQEKVKDFLDEYNKEPLFKDLSQEEVLKHITCMLEDEYIIKKNIPMIFLPEIIYRDGKAIGVIFLARYSLSEKALHLEFKIHDKYKEYRNKGIMGVELKKYLEMCSKTGQDRLIALTKEDNIFSHKLLKENNFIFIATMNDNKIYIKCDAEGLSWKRRSKGNEKR